MKRGIVAKANMLLNGLIQKCPVSVMGVIEQIYMTFSVDNNSFFVVALTVWNRKSSGAEQWVAKLPLWAPIRSLESISLIFIVILLFFKISFLFHLF